MNWERTRSMAFVLCFAAVSVFLTNVGSADEKGEKGDKAKAAVKKSADGEKSTAKKERAKPRGRLPNYFTDVVDSKQREKIYSIQSLYREKIMALVEQMKELQDEQQAEIDAVLKPEQLSKINARREEAKSLRAKRFAERTKPVEKKAGDTTKE